MMKLSTKLLLLLAAMLILGGVLLGAFTVAVLGLPEGEQYRTYRTDHAGDIGLITADIGSAAVQIKTATGDGIFVICNDVEDDRRITVTEQDGTLHIKNTPDRFRLLDIGSWFRFGDRPKYDVEIALPEAYAGRLELDITSGALIAEDADCASMKVDITSGSTRIEELRCAGDLDVKSSSGRVVLEDIVCGGSLTLDSVSGSVHLFDVKLDGMLTVDSTSGSLMMERIEAEGNITAELTSGTLGVTGPIVGRNINLRTISGAIIGNFLTAESVDAETTSGKILLQVIDADAIRLKTGSGSIYASVTDKQGAYAITSSTVSGSNNLPPVQSGGAKQLDVHTGSGSITIEFDAYSAKK